MDSILLVGSPDDQLPLFLEKLGYDVLAIAGRDSIVNKLQLSVLDCVVVDARHAEFAAETCEFLRLNEPTRTVPIVVLGADEESLAPLKELNLDKMEFLTEPFSRGALASRIALRLRMRKIDGADVVRATLAEMNATLRDLNARMLKEREEARKIQEALLPTALPAGDFLDLAVSYHPLDEVGGDWYFARETGDGAIELQVSDVTGHGLAAAFIGSMTKLAMFAAGGKEPHLLLREMNRLMTPQLPEGRFVTMCAAKYNPRSGELLFANAGHPPGLVLRRGRREVEQLKAEGFAIGFFEEGEYSLTRSLLEPGDVLVLCTDGILEARNRAGEFFGTARLAGVLDRCDPAAGAAELNGLLVEELHRFRDGRALKDDVTILVATRRSDPAAG